MFNPRCVAHGHNWENWYWHPAYEGGVEAIVDRDTFRNPNGTAELPKFRYKRACQNMGCDAVERADKLQPAGAHEIIDKGGSEVLYTKDEK